MAIKTKIWKLEGTQTHELPDGGFGIEKDLEDILFSNFGMLSADWVLIGRQVHTGFGFIDLLAMDRNGDVIVLELKKDRTPRDVVAQALDYGSWVRELDAAGIADIFVEFQDKYYPGKQKCSLDDHFENHFGQKLPEQLNSDHVLVVVAGAMDDSSERIVKYLSEHHGIGINFVLFRTFVDDKKSYITKTWLADPEQVVSAPTVKGKWNGEYYVSFGHGNSRSWADAKKYGFISGGGGDWYIKTLSMLKPGDRIWVNIPKVGYVGVGKVLAEAKPARDAQLNYKGVLTPASKLDLDQPNLFHDKDDLKKCEHLVAVEWIAALDIENAVSEVGLFGNQNTVCQPVTPKWDHTIKRLSSVLLSSRKAA